MRRASGNGGLQRPGTPQAELGGGEEHGHRLTDAQEPS